MAISAGRVAALALAALLPACGHDGTPPPSIRFLHTFDAAETELFNQVTVERGIAVESSQVPFARGQQVIGDILRAGAHCPDLIRIDATWLPQLVAAHLLAPAPSTLAALDWSPEAAALAQAGTPAAMWAVPQTVDGLMVVRDAARAAPADASIDALIAAARAARDATIKWPLGVRVDGYWLIPWLRADGVALGGDAGTPTVGGVAGIAGIDGPGAVHALATFAALFGDVAPPPPPAGEEAPDELRRWRAGEVAYWVTGPWQLGELATAARERVAVTALAHAPRGGQLLVVPTCAAHADDAWRLAGELSEVATQLAFATAFATVPTRRAALDAAPALVRAEYLALQQAEPLPRTTWTPLVFDDLNPALAAVVAGDATPDEAIAGVRRAWAKLTTTAAPPSAAAPTQDGGP